MVQSTMTKASMAITPAAILLTFVCPGRVDSFLAPSIRRVPTILRQSSEWSVADDWSAQSSEDQRNFGPDGSAVFEQDLAGNAARQMEQGLEGSEIEWTDEDRRIQNIIDEIYRPMNPDDPPLYDTGFETYTKSDAYSVDMENEIAMLVRCNQRPEQLLVESGRAVKELTLEEKIDPMQLVQPSNDGSKIEATAFLRQAVKQMFEEHAKADPKDGIMALDRDGVAKWMTQALKTEEGPVGSHDKRVALTFGKYSTYGSGRLVEEDFQKLYLATVTGDVPMKQTLDRHLQLRKKFVDAVFRDIRNHAIITPVELEHETLARQIRSEYGAATAEEAKAKASGLESLMDECEILDWDYDKDESEDSEPSTNERKRALTSKSSHRQLQMAKDGKTPLYVRDGELVFIDDESCIGCMQCANISPGSFMMTEAGRAQTYSQRNSPEVQDAVAACPVNCMHYVTYEELKQYETARDFGDGRTDHRHLGHRRGPTPLFVAGIDSDVNRRSSWYHTLKGNCVKSGACPQKGCYNCPRYDGPGENPYFQEIAKTAQTARTRHFIDSGVADSWRKTAEL